MSAETDPPEFTDSDRQWFAALSGEGARDPTSGAAREGAALRAALEAKRRQVESDPKLLEATGEESTEANLQKLMQRARDEGVFERPVQSSPAEGLARAGEVIEFPWWRRRRNWAALAACVLVSVLAVRQFDNGQALPEPPTMLGTGGMQRIKSATPLRSAIEFADQLRQANLRPGLYQRGKTVIVDVNLLAEELPGARPAFSALGLSPAVGFNRVEIGQP